MESAALVITILAGATLAGVLDPPLSLPARLGAGIAVGMLGLAVVLFGLLTMHVPLAAAATVPVLLALGWLLGYVLTQRPGRTLWHAWRARRARLPAGLPLPILASLGPRPGGPAQVDSPRGPQRRRPTASGRDGQPALAGTWAATARRTAQQLGPPALELALLLATLALLAGAGWLALAWPITTTDALRLFDGRARLLLTAGSLEGAAALAYDPAFFASYPPLTTLLYAWVYVLGGPARNPQYVSTLYTAAAALLLYGLLRPQVARPLAAAAALALVASRPVLEYATNAYTVAPALCYTAGAALLLDPLEAAPAAGPVPAARSARTGRLVLAGLFLGGAVWARTGSEPLALAIAGLALWQWRRCLPLARAAAALLLPPLLLAGGWLGYAQARLATVPPHETAAAIVAAARQAPPRELLTALRVLAQLPPRELLDLVTAEQLGSFARQFGPLVWVVDPALLAVFVLTALLAWPAQRRQAFLWAVLAALVGTTAAGFFALFLVYPRSLQDTPDSVLRLLLLAVPLLSYGTARNVQAVLDRRYAGRPQGDASRAPTGVASPARPSAHSGSAGCPAQ